jgi:NAD(P)H-dependent flavin oxidoreductase YrpB (nitropropane dioxygenase family)
MAEFPIPDVAQEVLDRFFRPEGRAEGEPYKLAPMYRQVVDNFRNHITVLGNFVEVWLAKEGHDGEVGINYLTKLQMPTLSSIYGAMLARVDYVLMGAGIPREIPGALDNFANHEPASIRLDVQGNGCEDDARLEFDPKAGWDCNLPPLKRPKFLPIIASNSLATMMAKKANGRVDGFIVEGPTAGGHNAPPRGDRVLNERGEPLYGEKDVVDLEKLSRLGLPFWRAGGTGHPGKIQETKEAGGAGIQVGTLFAYCDESGVEPELKRKVIELSNNGGIDIVTDGRASPTGFPFKVVELDTTLTSEEVYEKRERVCDLGYLRTAYRKEGGRIDYRCAAEPISTFKKKGGGEEETAGRKCLCNALMANIGHPQVRKDGRKELPLLTSGDELKNLGEFLQGRTSYTAKDVIDYLRS